MDEILGKWIFISQHGVEECLIKQNIGWIKRKLILSLAPNIIYSQPDENILRVEFQTWVKNMVRDHIYSRDLFLRQKEEFWHRLLILTEKFQTEL